MPSIDGLDALVNKSGDIEIDIDLPALENDIGVINEKTKNTVSRIDKKNINNLRDYLSKFYNKSKSGKFEMTWELDDHILKTYPLELMHIPEYNIEMTDYIKITDGRLIRINYHDMIEIIAFEIMYRDLGETLQSMEEKLSDLGITGVHPSYRIMQYIEDSPYDMSKIFKIGSSPYYVQDIDAIFEYFNTKRFKAEYYRECVEYSVKHALAIITKRLLEKFVAFNAEYKLCAVSDSGIYIITPASDVNINNIILNESVIVRAFGRHFEVKPEVTIF